jgi:hypothetical protein
MHNGFISVAKEMFPDAHICIDTFTCKIINDTSCHRRRLQRDMVDARTRRIIISESAARSLLTSETAGETRQPHSHAQGKA